MPDVAVVDQVRESVHIPSLPRIVARLGALLRKPDIAIVEIAEELKQDPPLAAHVLRIANSAYYAVGESVMDIERAPLVLGIRTVHDIVFRVAVMDKFEHVEDLEGFSIDGLWRHSVLVAELCQTLAGRCTKRLELGPNDLYACGLLHDLGRIVLIDTFGTKYGELLREAREAKVQSCGLELEHYGFSHPQVGAVVAFLWRLPEKLQDAIEFHHGPRSKIEAIPTVALVALCDHVARRVEERRELTAERLAQHPAYELAGVSLDALEDLIEMARERYRQIEL